MLNYEEFNRLNSHKELKNHSWKVREKFREILYSIYLEDCERKARNDDLIASGVVCVTEGVSRPLYNK